MAKSKDLDLAVVFGGPKGKPGAAAEDEAAMPEEGGDDELDPAFESAAVEAFPELAGDTERLAALKRMVQACY